MILEDLSLSNGKTKIDISLNSMSTSCCDLKIHVYEKYFTGEVCFSNYHYFSYLELKEFFNSLNDSKRNNYKIKSVDNLFSLKISKIDQDILLTTTIYTQDINRQSMVELKFKTTFDSFNLTNIKEFFESLTYMMY